MASFFSSLVLGLGELRTKIHDDCLLAKALDDSIDFDRLNRLRPIRGVLQHSSFEYLLRKPETDAGEHGPEPIIADQFDHQLWPDDRTVTRFANRVVESTGALLQDVVGILVGNPKEAVKIK